MSFRVLFWQKTRTRTLAGRRGGRQFTRMLLRSHPGEEVWQEVEDCARGVALARGYERGTTLNTVVEARADWVPL